MKILIVEDEILLADSLQALLAKNGFTVDVAYDGESGEEYAQLGVYDLLIQDVMMPKRNGYELAKADSFPQEQPGGKEEILCIFAFEIIGQNSYNKKRTYSIHCVNPVEGCTFFILFYGGNFQWKLQISIWKQSLWAN